MKYLDNPVLQRELLVNLRMNRAFVLLLLYQLLLAAVVYLAWPQENIQLDLSEGKNSSDLIDLFFLGQFVLASLMTPSFAAGARLCGADAGSTMCRTNGTGGRNT